MPGKKDDSVWSYNLRSYDFSDDDSDASEDAEVTTSRENPCSDDGQHDLDISSRVDTAQYKSNPWSIAKVNAACRKSVPVRSTPQTAPRIAAKKPHIGNKSTVSSVTQMSSTAPRKPNQRSLVKRKPHTPAQRVVPAVSLLSSVFGPSSNAIAPQKQPTYPILALDPSAPNGTSVANDDLVSLPMERLGQESASQMLPSSGASTPCKSQTTYELSGVQTPQFQAHIPPVYTLNARIDPAQEVSSSSYGSVSGLLLPASLSVSTPNGLVMDKTYPSHSQSPSVQSQGAKNDAPKVYHPQQITHIHTDDTQNTPHTHGANQHDLLERKAIHSVLASRAEPQRLIDKLLPATPHREGTVASAKRPQRSVHEASSSPMSNGHIRRDVRNIDKGPKMSISPVHMPHIAQKMTQSSSPLRGPDSRHGVSPTVASISHINAARPSSRTSPADIPAPRRHMAMETMISPAHKRTASPLNVSVAPAKRDAYAAFPTSPDAAWSTLPPPKKPRVAPAPAGKVRESGTFRLPLAHARAPEPVAQKTRVVTYLPPPRKAPSPHVTTGTRDEEGSRYPSPPGSELDVPPMSRARAPDAGHDADKHAPAARSAPSRPHPASRTALPSPPPSDPPEAAPPAAEDTQQDTDVRAHFDMRDLRQRYTLVRRRVAERKRLSAEVWPLLQLPSCGIVYCDRPLSESSQKGERLSEEEMRDDPQEQFTEIAIVTWQPSVKALEVNEQNVKYRRKGAATRAGPIARRTRSLSFSGSRGAPCARVRVRGPSPLPGSGHARARRRAIAACIAASTSASDGLAGRSSGRLDTVDTGREDAFELARVREAMGGVLRGGVDGTATGGAPDSAAALPVAACSAALSAAAWARVIVGFSTYRSGARDWGVLGPASVSASASGAVADSSSARNGLFGESRTGNKPGFRSREGIGAGGGVGKRACTRVLGWRREGGGDARPSLALLVADDQCAVGIMAGGIVIGEIAFNDEAFIFISV
ncbi:predicted protein [Postia placenta Mad-698-R]|uniref:Uncharacterized protein n=1 Tax=Postia placenta MAD-698-R-SB12 TaxID=670580 RepID=A0A1X6N440_9APHY|nr:hypothetical protein POSPLADRAFT_1065694 [Postia placenta MAD-698-R-SB12]EED84514.1 predicted protein [Postia placenta Mad-698-R]OSX63411.1 hypothetical protein POSPLADRAFT_1065694 [Postia placenta MAD-698-R-SB12]